MYTDRNSHSTAYGPYGWLPAGQPNATCMHASGAPSSVCELRWTLEVVADVEAVVVLMWPAAATGLAPTVVPALACNISQ